VQRFQEICDRIPLKGFETSEHCSLQHPRNNQTIFIVWLQSSSRTLFYVAVLRAFLARLVMNTTAIADVVCEQRHDHHRTIREAPLGQVPSDRAFNCSKSDHINQKVPRGLASIDSVRYYIHEVD
jgi:hypothetical protein